MIKSYRAPQAKDFQPDHSAASALSRFARRPTDSVNYNCVEAARRRLIIKMPDPKDDPKSSEWRPYIFARDQWHCRICGDRFLYPETVRKHIANEHNETMPPSMYEYFHGAVWQRKKLP
jgi:hypothetical protein